MIASETKTPRRGAALLVLCVACVGGCRGPAPSASLGVVRLTGDRPASARAAERPDRVSYAEVADVLTAALCSEGKLRIDRLKASADALDAQLRLLESLGPTASPELFASPADRLAYWYNARAAWAMKIALLAWPDEPDGDVDFDVFDRQWFRLDGREMTLAAIDDLLAAEFGWRAAVASPGVRIDRAPLPAEPFDPATVEAAVQPRVEAFVDDAERVIVDVEAREVRVPQILWRFRGEIVDCHHRTYHTRGATLTTALLSCVGGRAERRLQLAIGYEPVPRGRGDALDVCENPLH